MSPSPVCRFCRLLAALSHLYEVEKKKKVVKCKAKKSPTESRERDATSCKSRRDFEQCLISIRYMFCPYAEKGELLRGKLIIQEKEREVEVKLLGRRET